MESEPSWAERFYTHFISRDFTQLFSGGLLICMVEYALYDKVFLPQQISLELFGFLSASYFLGVVITNFAVLIRPSLNSNLPEGYKSLFILHQKLIDKKFDSSVLNGLERLNFLRLIGVSIGSSSFLGGILILLITFGRWILEDVPFSRNHIIFGFGLMFVGLLVVVYIGELLSRSIETHWKALLEWTKKID